MPKFGNASQKRLYTCDQRLQELCNEAIKIIDFSVLCGYRDGAEQARLFSEGKTKLQYPMSKHNQSPSKAIDIAPYPIDWNDTGRFKLLAGVMFGIAHNKGYKLRWGGDWDGDWDMKDQTFNDLPHFELIT